MSDVPILSGSSKAVLEMKYDSPSADNGDSPPSSGEGLPEGWEKLSENWHIAGSESGTSAGSLDLVDAQRNDPTLRPLILRLMEPNSTDTSVTAKVRRQEATLYQMESGVLCRKTEGRAGLAFSPTLRPVIPSSLQLAVLREHHDGVCGAHLGEAKTYGKLSAKYYWSGMFNDVKKYVQSCPRCAARKTAYHHRDIPIGSLPIPKQPFEALGIDVLGPLPKTRCGNRYIL